MATYILAFSNSLPLGEVLGQARLRTELDPEISVERGWQGESVPGRFVVFQAPRSDRLRDALSKMDASVEGIVELLPDADEGDFEESTQALPAELSVEQLSVLREQTVNDAFQVYGFAPPPLVWCSGCETAHRRGWHVK